MASQKQIEANRRNAQLSTGPTSEEGKAGVARNATTHGFYCRHLVLRGECEQDILALRKSVRDRLQPADELESLYCERVVVAAWKLNRILSAEQGAYNGMTHFFTGIKEVNHYVHCNQQTITNNQKLITTLERSMDKAIAELIKLRKNLEEGIAPESWARFDAPSSAIVENKPNSPEQVAPKAPEPQERAAAMTIDVVQPTPIDKNTKTNPIVYRTDDATEVKTSETNPIASPVERSNDPTAQQESPGLCPGPLESRFNDQ